MCTRNVRKNFTLVFDTKREGEEQDSQSQVNLSDSSWGTIKRVILLRLIYAINWIPNREC